MWWVCFSLLLQTSGSRVTISFWFPTRDVWVSWFFHILVSTWCWYFFILPVLNIWYIVISHCDFDIHFLNVQWFKYHLMLLFVIWSCFAVKCLFMSFTHFLIWLFSFLLLSFWVLSVQFSLSVVSNCLWPHGLQHARLPCPSPAPRACSDSCPSSQGSLYILSTP